MKLEYTIISGYIDCKGDKAEITFALVFIEDGIYRIETFLKDEDFFESHKDELYFTLIGITEKKYNIEIHGLSYTKYNYSNLKIELICRKYIKLSDNRKHEHNDLNINNQERELIWFIEIEGMKMQFGDHTQFDKYRYSEKVEEFVNFKFDHTKCMLVLNHPNFIGSSYNLIFTKNELDNIIIDFTQYKGYNKFYFDNYLEIRTELISFLSLINGGQIFVRRELTGLFYQTESKDAQIVFYYSRKQLLNISCDNYLPINEHHSHTKIIFINLFMRCFDKYYHLNKDLDFNALIFSLNNSHQTNGIEERYFILITALEKICSLFFKNKTLQKQTLIDKNKFNSIIKPKLLDVLKLLENEIKKENNSAYNILKSKLAGLNNSNGDLKQRMYEFFEYSKIPINNSVKSLIDVERHLAVHEGIIGNDTKEKVANYLKLDHILRDCILNIIEYKSYRRRKIEYFSKSEMLHEEMNEWE